MKAGVAHPAVFTHPMIGTFPGVSYFLLWILKIQFPTKIFSVITQYPVQPLIAVILLRTLLSFAQLCWVPNGINLTPLVLLCTLWPKPDCLLRELVNTIFAFFAMVEGSETASTAGAKAKSAA